MPAHIWMRTGDYVGAAKTNNVAAALDEKYVKATGAKGFYPTMYYGHNLQFESAAAMMAGNFSSARAAGVKTANLVAPMAGEKEILALLRFGRYDEVLAQPAPPAGRDLQTSLYHFTRGAAFAGKGQAPEAEKELAAFNTSSARVTKDIMYSTVNPAPIVLDVARLDLAARVADAKGGGAPAVAAWRRAVAADDKVGYGEPPDWLFPTRESLAAALMRIGNAAEAEKVYRADLQKNRLNPRSLFGLWKALERQGKTAEAAKIKAEFDTAWAGADTKLDESQFAARKTTN